LEGQLLEIVGERQMSWDLHVNPWPFAAGNVAAFMLVTPPGEKVYVEFWAEKSKSQSLLEDNRARRSSIVAEESSLAINSGLLVVSTAAVAAMSRPSVAHQAWVCMVKVLENVRLVVASGIVEI
jgi:hypothetical protein